MIAAGRDALACKRSQCAAHGYLLCGPIGTGNVRAGEALSRCLDGYQNPVPEDVLETQMRLAVR